MASESEQWSSLARVYEDTFSGNGIPVYNSNATEVSMTLERM